MLLVHHLENSRSQRILWILEELGVEYQIKRYERDKETSYAPPALKQIHPLGKSPILCDDALVIAESGAIIEYVIDKYDQGKLKPPSGSPEHIRYLYWLHSAEGSLMPLLVFKLLFSRVESKAPLLIKPVAKGIARKVVNGFITPNLKALLDFVEADLTRSTWLAGDQFTGADIQMGYPLQAAEARVGLSDYPKIRAFLDRIRSRPAYITANEKGGPFQLLTR